MELTQIDTDRTVVDLVSHVGDRSRGVRGGGGLEMGDGRWRSWEKVRLTSGVILKGRNVWIFPSGLELNFFFLLSGTFFC
jgi:hypothetical protein